MNRRHTLAGMMAAMLPWPAQAAKHTWPAQAATRQPNAYLRTNWSRDPYAFGSYSYLAKGSRQRDRRTLEAPLQAVVFFAGEAVFPDHNGTVHAAHESGLRTAKMVQDQAPRTVAIIGAGMAGLTAAHHLAAQGVSVTVFEARARPGGRLFTDNTLGAALDLGASWIHGTHGNPLTTLANQAALKRVETDDSYVTHAQTYPRWLSDIAEIQHVYGADRDQINLRAEAALDAYSGPHVIFPGGYSDILHALKGDYSVHLNTPVSHIHYTDQGATLQTSLDTTADLRFDAVIVTLPLGVLKQDTVTFDPPLPHAKQDAIKRLGMGVLDKLYLQYDEIFWDRDVTWIETPDNDLPRGQFNQWFNMAKYIDAPIIMAFNGGSAALDLAHLDDTELVEKAIQTLTQAYPT